MFLEFMLLLLFCLSFTFTAVLFFFAIGIVHLQICLVKLLYYGFFYIEHIWLCILLICRKMKEKMQSENGYPRHTWPLTFLAGIVVVKLVLWAQASPLCEAQSSPLCEMMLSWICFQHVSNKNIDIKFNAHNAFLFYTSSGDAQKQNTAKST